MENAVANMSDYADYQAYADKYNEASKPDFKILKLLNKEGREGFGEWWVDRKVDGLTVVTAGEKVAAGIVVAVYNQYSYFDRVQKKNICRTEKMFKSFPNGLKGSHFDYQCGPECPHKVAKNCKMQKIVFMMAITEAGNKIPCIYYCKGSAFMPFTEFFNKATSQIINGKVVHVPMFALVVMFGSKGPMMNGDAVYYVPEFKLSKLLPASQLTEFAAMADQVKEWVDNGKPVADEDEDHSPQTHTSYNTQPARQDMEVMDDAPFDVTQNVIDIKPKAAAEEVDDIAASINKALGL